MHEALARLGVPAIRDRAGTRLRHRQLHEHGPGRHALHRRRAGFHLRPHRPALHPGQDVRIENFRDTKLPPLDAVIGNVPFADVKLEHHGERFSLHDYFIAKSVDSLKPGGVLALVTSHFTLDKQNASIRQYLAERADFLGAVRLPATRVQERRHGGRHRRRVPAQRARARKPITPIPTGNTSPPWRSKAPASPSTAIS